MIRRLIGSIFRKQTLLPTRSSQSIKNRILRHYFGRIYYDNRTQFMISSQTLNETLDHRSLKMPGETTSNIKSEASHSPDIEILDDSGCLNKLRTAYEEALRNSSNVWLDCANKSCYIYLYRGGGEPNPRICAFDLDGTLIKPKSNKRIPRSATDWELYSVWTKIKLQQALNDYKSRFVIFTNQNGIGLNMVALEEVQERIESVVKKLGLPCTVFMAVEKDEFRKPRTGMFQLFDKSFNGSETLDNERSFYCGDAVGYPSHSDADIKFASKLGLPFLPPEKFLRGVIPKLIPQN